MAHTNHTTNYELSQFLGSDKPSWLNDYNGDMAKIDTAVKNAADAASTAASTASGLSGTVNTLTNTTIPGIQGDISDLQGADTRIEGKADEALINAQKADMYSVDEGGSSVSYIVEFWHASGFLSGGDRDANLFIDLPKRFNPNKTPTFNAITVNGVLRGVGGYMYGSSSVNFLTEPDFTVTVDKAGTSQIRIKIRNDNQYTSGSNNAPISFYGTIEIEIM